MPFISFEASSTEPAVFLKTLPLTIFYLIIVRLQTENSQHIGIGNRFQELQALMRMLQQSKRSTEFHKLIDNKWEDDESNKTIGKYVSTHLLC